MKALVVGATGQTGRYIVQQLIDRGITVRALVRDTDKATAILPATTEIRVGDVLKSDTLQTAMADCSVVLCATGAQPSFDMTGPYKVDYKGSKNLVDAAKTSGIQQFVMVSSLCVSKFFHPLNLFWLVLYWKKQAEGYIQNSGLTYTIVRPGGLRNEDNDNPIVMASADSLFEGGIPRAKVAQVCIEALFDPQAKNKIVEIVSREEAPEQSFEAMFADVA